MVGERAMSKINVEVSLMAFSKNLGGTIDGFSYHDFAVM